MISYWVQKWPHSLSPSRQRAKIFLISLEVKNEDEVYDDMPGNVTEHRDPISFRQTWAKFL